MKTFTSIFAAALVSGVSGHSFFQELYVNGVSAGHNVGIRQAPNSNPVEDVNSSNMICNVSPTSPTEIIPVKAGDVLTTEWHHGLNGVDPNDADDPIAASHKGPIIGYLAKVDSATQSNVVGLEWFKIYEEGYDGTQWAVDKMIANGGKFDIPLPSCIPDGDYLFRAELIALHSAYNYPGAQFYMECAQITVSGGSGSLPTDTVSIPGLYSGSDPGITISIYNDFGDYVIPGPAVFTCGAGSPTTKPVASSSAEATSTPAAASPSAPATTSEAATPTATATDSPEVTTTASLTPIETTTTPTPTPVTPPTEDEEEDDSCEAEYEQEPIAVRSIPIIPVSDMNRRASERHRALHFVA